MQALATDPLREAQVTVKLNAVLAEQDPDNRLKSGLNVHNATKWLVAMIEDANKRKQRKK